MSDPLSHTLMECAAVVVQNPIVRGLFVVFVGLLDLVIGRWYASFVDRASPTRAPLESEAVRAHNPPIHERSVAIRPWRRGVFWLLAAGLLIAPMVGCSSSPDASPDASQDEATFVAFDGPNVANHADADTAIERIEATERVKSAAVEATARVDELTIKSRARLAARADFADQVKRWTGLSLLALAAVGIAALVGSMLPLGRGLGLDTNDAARALAAVVVVSLVRYALLAWGILAADAAVIVCIVLAVVAALAVGLPLGYGWFRRNVWATYRTLASKNDEARASTAVWALAVGATGEGDRDKVARAATLETHTIANQHYYAARRGPESQA